MADYSTCSEPSNHHSLSLPLPPPQQVFRRRVGELENLTGEQIERSRKELADLERKFLERVAQTNRSKTTGGGVVKCEYYCIFFMRFLCVFLWYFLGMFLGSFSIFLFCFYVVLVAVFRLYLCCFYTVYVQC